MFNVNLPDWTKLPQILKVKQIAKILGVSKNSVYSLFKQSDFPAVKIGEKTRITFKDKFKDWLENRLFKNQRF
jgi:excisionase family DNA binding protein